MGLVFFIVKATSLKNFLTGISQFVDSERKYMGIENRPNLNMLKARKKDPLKLTFCHLLGGGGL